MTIDMAVYIGQQALFTALYVAGPLLGTALVVGVIISVLQAVTQVQEMTLVFVPKILVVFLVLGVLGGWMLQLLVSFGTWSFMSIGSGM